MDHLNEQAIRDLDLPLAERVTKINSQIWIGYPRQQQINARLEDLLVHPQVARMPCMLLYGDSNVGKTRLIRHFAVKKIKSTDEEESPTLPVFMTLAPSKPDEHELYCECLRQLNSPHRPSASAGALRDQLCSLLKDLQTRMFVIDEVHNMVGGTPVKQRIFLSALKTMSNKLQIPIVAIGTRDAFNAFSIDSQISSRFEPVALPRWSDGVDFRRLLATFVKATPLRERSLLSSDDVAAKLLEMSEGLLGELAEVIRRSAIAEIKAGRERITMETLSGLDWTPPSGRR